MLPACLIPEKVDLGLLSHWFSSYAVEGSHCMLPKSREEISEAHLCRDSLHRTNLEIHAIGVIHLLFIDTSNNVFMAAQWLILICQPDRLWNQLGDIKYGSVCAGVLRLGWGWKIHHVMGWNSRHNIQGIASWAPKFISLYFLTVDRICALIFQASGVVIFLLWCTGPFNCKPEQMPPSSSCSCQVL